MSYKVKQGGARTLVPTISSGPLISEGVEVELEGTGDIRRIISPAQFRGQFIFMENVVTVTDPVPNPTPDPEPTPEPEPTPSRQIGPIALSYRQGGIWLTLEEIAQIPTNNTSWESLVTWSKKPLDIVKDITWTAGGAGSGEAVSPRAILARVIVGIRTGNTTLLNQAKAELDRFPQAVSSTSSDDEKWAQRHIGPIAVAANILGHRPAALREALRHTIYIRKFDGGKTTIQESAMRRLTNKAAWGRWAYMTVAYLIEDMPGVEACVRAHAKAMGEKNWGSAVNPHKFQLSGLGSEDNWQTLHPGGKADPIAIMPMGITWQNHGVGGLWLADQYRAANGPEWPPTFTDYVWEGMASYQAVMWAAHHLGYRGVFALGQYAMIRAYVFMASTHDSKPKWTPTGNDTWQTAAMMAYAKPLFQTLPELMKPEPNAPVIWPPTVSPSGEPGRGMGWMYATHYARLVR